MAETGKKKYGKGALIYIESDEESDNVFVLETGEVELTGTPGLPRFRSLLGPGDIFGFTSCLCRRPRMETAIARTDCMCAVLERERFIESVEANPEVAGRIISYFAQELRAFDQMVVSPSEEASVSDDETRLYELAEYYQKKRKEAHARHAWGVYQRRFPGGSRGAEAAAHIASLTGTVGPPAAPVTRGLCRVFADRQMIFCEYEPGNELYIIKSGKVEILKINPPEEILLSILREGDIFGELSIVSSAPRSATAVSAGETLLLPVSRESLPSVFGKSPATVGRILAALSQRLWFTFIRLRAKVYENPLTRAYVLLENKLLEDRVSLTSTKPYMLPLGIADILGMAGVPSDQMDSVKGLLSDDRNLAFQFRQLTIENPSALEAKARYFRTRDHLDSPELKAAVSPRKRAGRIGLDMHELRVPPEKIPG
jgi:CRP/FNR family transcriptional regulator